MATRSFYSKSEISMNIKNNLVNQDSELVEDSVLMLQPVSAGQSDMIDLLIERQNKKQAALLMQKHNLNKLNEQTSFYITLFRYCICLGLAILLGCLIASENAKKKSEHQLETEALLQQLEKGEVIEMTARVGAKP